MSIWVEASATSDDCCPLCDGVQGCEGYVFFDQYCYLKSGISGTFAQPGRISRTRLPCAGYQAAEQDKDLAGDMLEQWSASSPEVCCSACAQRSDCQGFAFLDDRCYLKGNVTGTYSNPGCMARMKEGIPAVATPAPVCPDFGAQANDTDLSGELLSQTWVGEGATSDDCCPLCDGEEGCEGYVFFDQVCYLKGSVSGTYAQSGRISRTRLACAGYQAAEQDKDLAGDMLEQWSAASPEVCCAACAEKTQCEGFAFLDDRCYLKGNVTGTYSNPGCMVRLKEGIPAGHRRLGGAPLLV